MASQKQAPSDPNEQQLLMAPAEKTRKMEKDAVSNGSGCRQPLLLSRCFRGSPSSSHDITARLLAAVATLSSHTVSDGTMAEAGVE